jgi:hypothetical protein
VHFEVVVDVAFIGENIVHRKRNNRGYPNKKHHREKFTSSNTFFTPDKNAVLSREEYGNKQCNKGG